MMKRKREEVEGAGTGPPSPPGPPFPDQEGQPAATRCRHPAMDPATPLRISEVRLRLPPDSSGPIVAYASCLIQGCLVLNDIRIERGRQGGLVVVYPSKPSSTGKRHSTFHPVTREAGEALRRALLAGRACVDNEVTL